MPVMARRQGKIGRAKGAKARRATYGGATRMARLVFGLVERPYGWSFGAIEDELGISERTLLRYVSACRKELVDAQGEPRVETIRRGERRLLRLREPFRGGEPTGYELLFLYFALSVFRFLDGTVIEEGVEGLWERFLRALPAAEQARLSDFRKKFYAVPYAMKDYRKSDEILDTIVRCLVRQNRMRVDYAGLLGDGHVHEFEPYTLLLYRGGLYLLGKSHLGNRIVTLAVERMRGAEQLAERFEYPKTYSPEKQTEGTFGIIEGPETDVEILVMNPETLAYLKSRRIHPTQRFRPRRDGKTVLSMTVRGTDELRNWILGFGPFLQVLKPRELREEVAGLLRNAARLYGR